MFVNHLATETSGRQQTIDEPTWNEIESSLRTLQNADAVSKCSTVVLSSGSDGLTNMLVDGLGDEFVVQVSFGDGYFHYLADDSRNDVATRRVVGGQRVDWPNRHVANFVTALKAVRSFAESGSLDKDLDWVRL